jgi:sterol desaturase/sphingolipid hydroxylase (fatty acid hydroxylase superfamily)
MTVASVAGELLLGWLAADLATAIFHWWEDRFGREDWPVIGPWIIAPNRLHHAEPLAFTAGDFLDRNRASIGAALIVGAAMAALLGPSIWLAALLVGVSVTNEVHRFAHQPSASPTWLRMLQQTGVVQSPKAHAAHHRPPFDRNYCVLTDWLNPLLEQVRFWPRLERLCGRAAA